MTAAARAYTGPCAEAFASRCQPRPPLTLSEWADQNRVVPPGTSPEPGAWRTDRVPYLKEILDAVSDPSVENIYVQAASQVAKSEILLNAIGYFAEHDPSPILLVQPTEEAMKAFSKERIAPMFDASPALRGLLDEAERSPTNTIMIRQFPGGMLAGAWAGSAASLSARPIRIVAGDELDRWPDTTGRDGDPWHQAQQRASNFFNRKKLAVSTPTIDEVSAIARLYAKGDRREYHVPCPRCGVLQVLEWSGVIYKNDAGDVDLDQVHYKCADCGGRIEEREKPAMLDAGEWVPGPREPGEAPADPKTRSYHISAICSPWVRWRDLAQEWITAQADRDKRGQQEFTNLRLGETWTEAAQKITIDALEKNREHYDAEIPDGVLIITAGVDVQDNRFEAEVVGWGVGRESWGIHYEIIVGDTSLDTTWQRLDEFLARSWSRPDERRVGLVCTCVDSGGHRTDEVYAFCRDRHARNVFAIKGRGGAGLPVVDKPKLNKLRAPLFMVGVDAGKDALYSRLVLPDQRTAAAPAPTAGPGYCHFPIGRGYDDEYFKGLVSERRVTKVRAGRRKTEWIQGRARNEPLDVRIYATAAMEILAPDFSALAALEAKARGETPQPTVVRMKQRRRVLSRGVG